MPKLMLSGKVCLRPTKAQARLLEKYAKAAIWTWNECLSWWQERYDVQGLNTNSNDCIKHLQHLKRESPEHYWLQSIPESVTKRVIKQLETAYKDFYAGKKGHPKYKKQTQSNMSFYQRTDRFRVVDATHVKITGIRDHVKVETTSGIPEKVYNTVVSWDGKHWQLAYAYEITPPTNTSKTKLVLALDGETFARTSNGMVFEDYHVTNTKYLTLEKRFNTWNAQLENKYKTNGYKKT
jgi:putative transposase